MWLYPATLGAMLIISPALVSGTTANGSGHFHVPLTQQSDRLWRGNFTVGRSHNLSLAISTSVEYIAIGNGLYNASDFSVSLSNESYEVIDLTGGDFGCTALLTMYNASADVVSVPGLQIRDQAALFGFKQPYLLPDITERPSGQGILGLSNNTTYPEIYSEIPGISFFRNLCNYGNIHECRFGLALGLSGKGGLTLGQLSDTLYEGGLTRTPAVSPGYYASLSGPNQWWFSGRVVFNGTAVVQDKYMALDSGITNIMGPMQHVQQIFKAAGMQTSTPADYSCGTLVYGFYNCSAPPKIYIELSDGGPATYIRQEALKLRDNGNDNCTAAIVGTSASNFWTLGQPWFQGWYVDFDINTSAVSIAYLKDPYGVRRGQ